MLSKQKIFYIGWIFNIISEMTGQHYNLLQQLTHGVLVFYYKCHPVQLYLHIDKMVNL